MKITKFGVTLLIAIVLLSALYYLDTGEFRIIGSLVIVMYILELTVTFIYKVFQNRKNKASRLNT